MEKNIQKLCLTSEEHVRFTMKAVYTISVSPSNAYNSSRRPLLNLSNNRYNIVLRPKSTQGIIYKHW